MTHKKTTKKAKAKKEKWTWEHTLGALGFIIIFLLLLNPVTIAGIILFALIFEPVTKASYWGSVPEQRASNYEDPFYGD